MKNKNRKKIIKVIAILFCIFMICTVFTCASVMSSVMSMAVVTNHIESCHDYGCPVCALIKIAIYFTENLNYIIEYIFLLDIVIPLYCILIEKIFEKTQVTKITLITQKVRLDE